VTTSGLTTQHAQPIVDDTYNYKGTDAVSELKETLIGYEGMRIDREMFNSFANRISKDEYIVEKVTEDDYEAIDEYINEKYFEKPEDYLNLNKLRKSMGVDWLVPLRQILELIFKKRDRIKGKYEVLDDEFDNFLLIHKPESHYVPTAKRLFKAYITDEEIRAVVNAKEYAKLSTSPKVSLQDIMALNGWRETIPQYVKDYVPLSYFKQ
jgi:type I restriction enzyme R subunit